MLGRANLLQTAAALAAIAIDMSGLSESWHFYMFTPQAGAWVFVGVSCIATGGLTIVKRV